MRNLIYSVILTILVATSSGLAQIEVSLPDTSADTGSMITIPVSVTELTGLNVISCQIEISYNSTVVKPTDVLTENTLFNFCQNIYSNLSEPGLVLISAIDLDTLAGSGTLLNILFEVIGQPFDSTDLIFEYCEFSGETASIQTNNGKLTVNTNIINVTITTNVLDSSKVIVDDTLRNVPYQTNWIKGDIHTVEVTTPQDMGNGIQYLFNRWSDGGAIAHTVFSRVDTNFTAYFTPQYYLTVSSDFGSPQGEAWYDSGAVAYFSVANQILDGEDTRFNFVSWTGSGENSYSGADTSSSVIMTNPITEQANWATEFYLQVESTYGSPFGQGWYAAGDTADFGVASVFISMLAEKYYFNSWIGQGTGSYSGSNPQNSVIITNPLNEIANWDAEFYMEIRSEPPGLLEIVGSDWYPSGEPFVTITAPDTIIKDTTKFFFQEWLVNGEIIAGNPITVNIDSPLVVLANYRFLIDIVVTTNIGAATKVIVDEVERQAPYTADWMSDEFHTISVQDYQSGDAGIRYAFDFWNDKGAQTHQVISDQDTTFVVNLRTQYYLEVTTIPDDLFSIAGAGWYNAEQDTVLLEAPRAGSLNNLTYRFKKWNIDGDDFSDNPITIIMTSPKSAEAYYEKAFNISGFISENDNALPDARLVISGAETDTIYSDQNGLFKFEALFEGDYQIFPYKSGYKFEPESRTYQPLTEDLADQNFAATDSVVDVNTNSENEIPEQYMLRQNYPNPFNSTTIIYYTLPQKSTITLTIYNLLGKSVKSFFMENLNAGNYFIQWNGKDDFGSQLSSGMYIYKLTADDAIISKKMIMLE